MSPDATPTARRWTPLARAARRTRGVARRLTGPEPQPLELEDIQGNILRSYTMPVAAYLFLRLDDAAQGRRLLRDLAEHLVMERAGPWPEGAKPAWALNLAFTARGLHALGLGDDALASFPPEFLAGMPARAERFLGDTGPSTPEHWEPGLRGEAHALVMIHARSAEDRSQALRVVGARLAQSVRHVTVVHTQLAQFLEGQREHFGFTDGFSQPAVAGSPVGMRPGEGVPDGRGGFRPLRAGEFVLGYTDEDDHLPEAPRAPYGINGSFMVYRKLHQDVARFRQLLRRRAEELALDEELLAAKVVGRWRDGTPLIMSPDRPDPAIGYDPDRSSAYGYAKDPHGFACPLGAHVRRANPRDGLVGGVDRSRRHRLIRRGMPYGPPLVGEQDDGVERGLVFVCFNASIARQFEVVQGWLLDGNLFRVGEESDYLLGSNHANGGKMTIHGDPPVYLSPQLPFVITRGGEYLFVPGGRALSALLAPETSDRRVPVADPAVSSRAVTTPLARTLARLTKTALFARPTLALLRTFKPIARTSAGWLVTRDDDVREVLTRHRDFTVPYLIRMEAMTGPFILGFDDGEVYRRERDALAAAVPRSELARIKAISADAAERALRRDTELDVVTELADPVIEATIEHVMGFPFPDAATLADWSRAVFWEVFINPERDQDVVRRSARAADAMRRHLDARIAERRVALAGGAAAEDHMLDRLLRQRDDEPDGPWRDLTRMRDSLFGLIAAWSVSVSRVAGFALSDLLRRPSDLAAAQRAARSGDDHLVTMALMEALRFRPQTEALPRRCPNGATIAAGTRRERTILPGDVVIASTKSAMLDRRGVGRPTRFSMARPDDEYLHFGYGLHRCFGEHIARVQLAAIATALLVRDVSRTGRMRMEGPFPSRLPVAVVGPPARAGSAAAERAADPGGRW